jgi:hypothetical protein
MQLERSRCRQRLRKALGRAPARRWSRRAGRARGDDPTTKKPKPRLVPFRGLRRAAMGPRFIEKVLMDSRNGASARTSS